jgi:hypothetical protein
VPDKHWNYENVRLAESGAYFQSEKILRIIESPFTETRILNRQPMLAYYCEKHRARLELFLNRGHEILAGRYAVGVLENTICPKVLAKPGYQREYVAGCIFASVADEDS